MGFLKFILWVLLIYYFFKLVFRGLAKYAMHKLQNQQGQFGEQFAEVFRQQQQQKQQQQQHENVQVGKTTIQTNKTNVNKKQKGTDDLGEYIDFEEA